MIKDFKKIEEAFNIASPEVINLMFSEEVANKIILKTNPLGIKNEMIDDFLEEVGLLFLGLNNIENFETSITEKFKLTKESSLKIKDYILSEINFLKEKSDSGFTRGDNIVKKNPFPPPNLPTNQPHLEPMILSKDQNPFLPPLRKIFSQPQPESPKKEPEPEVWDKHEDRQTRPQEKPAEQKNKESSERNGPTKPQMTSELAAEISNLLEKKNDQTTQNSGAFTYPKSPSKPEDKLEEMTQKPRAEVEMFRKEESKNEEPKTDPYREPIE